MNMACSSTTSLQKARQKARGIFMQCLPHVFLCIVYLLYLLFGTLMFQVIEGTGSTEFEDYYKNVGNKRRRLEAAMWNKTHGLETDTTNWTQLLDEYTDLVCKPEWKMGRLRAAQYGVTWSFASTMLFCLVTISTIGYGDIVPITRGGRIFVGFYATFGIPLNVIFLADVGFLMAKLIVLIIRTCRMCYFYPGKSVEKNSDSTQKVFTEAGPPAKSMRTTHKKRRKKSDGISQCRTMSCHGPRSVAKRTEHQILDPKRLTNEGKKRSASSILPIHCTKPVVKSDQTVEIKHAKIYPQFQDTSFINEKVADHAKEERQSVDCQNFLLDATAQTSDDALQNTKEQPHRSRFKCLNEKNSVQVDVNSIDIPPGISKADEVSDDLNHEEEMVKTEVSLIVVFFILITCMCIGAHMIATIEGWEYGESFYFTFITLTTIGYGDVLPTNHYSEHVFFSCIIYTVFGLAVMSTCIALVQAKVLRAIDRLTLWIHSCLE